MKYGLIVGKRKYNFYNSKTDHECTFLYYDNKGRYVCDCWKTWKGVREITHKPECAKCKCDYLSLTGDPVRDDCYLTTEVECDNCGSKYEYTYTLLRSRKL